MGFLSGKHAPFCRNALFFGRTGSEVQSKDFIGKFVWNSYSIIFSNFQLSYPFGSLFFQSGIFDECCV